MAEKKPKENTKSRISLNLRVTLFLYALIPLLFSSVILGAFLISKNSSQVRNSISRAFISEVEGTGEAFDYITETNEKILQAYAAATVLTEYLLDPDNAELAEKAEQ